MQEERRLLLRVGDPATVPIHNSCRDAMRTLPSLVVQRCVSFAGSCELSVGGRVLVGGLRVEVEVLGDERTSTPAVVKVLGWCLALPAALCRLIVVVGVICWSVWRASI